MTNDTKEYFSEFTGHLYTFFEEMVFFKLLGQFKFFIFNFFCINIFSIGQNIYYLNNIQRKQMKISMKGLPYLKLQN